MIEKIKALCIKYRELIVYIIMGGLTTVVAWGCKFLWNAIFLALPSPIPPTASGSSAAPTPTSSPS